MVNWIAKNLENTHDPRILGKSLRANLKNYWGYKIVNYRIIAGINDDEVRILIIEIDHRKDIYKKL